MPQDFASRLERGWLRLQADEGKRVDQKEIGKRAGKAIGRKAFSQASVSRWFNGTVPDDIETILGIARALRVDPGWLAFGSESAAPMEAASAAVLPVVLDRAGTLMAKEQPEKPAPGKARRRRKSG